MPIHDFSCPGCATELADVYQPRLATLPPLCPQCGIRMERVWALSSGGKVKFSEFDLETPSGEKHHISSLHQLRQLERASESTSRPFVCHQYSIDKGQGPERNAFGPPPNQAVNPRTKRGVPFIKCG